MTTSYKRGVIAAHHPANSPAGKRRDRLERARHNHRAFVAGVTNVHPDWYNMQRHHNARMAMNRNLIPVLPVLVRCIQHSDPADPETLSVTVAARHSVIKAYNFYNEAKLMDDDTDALASALINEPDGEKYVAALREACVMVCNAAEAAQDYHTNLYLQLHDTMNELLEILAPEPEEFEVFQRQLEINMAFIDLMPDPPEPKKTRMVKPNTVESLLRDQQRRRRQL